MNHETTTKGPGSKPLSRRQVLGRLSAYSSVLLPFSDSLVSQENVRRPAVNQASPTSTATNPSGASCALIPRETEGPFPLQAVLNNSAIIRREIAEDKTGVPLTLKIKLVSVNNNCTPIDLASVYVWHCDKDGVYSGYPRQTGGINATGETFCRGIQEVDSNGEVTFRTIYPGWYRGRITHIHFQVFLQRRSMATATSQIAFPQSITEIVYNSSHYASRGQNASVTSFAKDSVFRDGTSLQIAKVTGNIDSGYEATLTVGLAI